MQFTISGIVAAFFFFVGLAYALFGVMWIQAYRIKPANPQDPARFQAIYYWKLHRKHYPHSVLPYGVLISVIIALLVVIIAPGFLPQTK